MEPLREIRSFIEVVEAGSFVGAADVTGLSKQAVSRHVVELERRLGLRLLNRTTRRLSLTTEGEAYFRRVSELVDELDGLEQELSSGRAEPIGRLRVAAPLTFGILRLAPLWGPFLERYPKVSLAVDLNDRVVDLVEEGYDLAIRIMNLPSSQLVGRKLAATRLVLCASPDYLKLHGTPTTPDELQHHQAILYSYLKTGNEWELTGPDGKASRVRLRSRFHTNSGDTCRAAALAHQGIVYQPEFLVAADLEEGRLIELLPEFRGLDVDIHAVYPSREYLPMKTRRLVDYLVSAFSEPPWIDPVSSTRTEP